MKSIVLKRNGKVAVDGAIVGDWSRDYVPIGQCDYRLRWLAKLNTGARTVHRRRVDLVAAIEREYR